MLQIDRKKSFKILFKVFFIWRIIINIGNMTFITLLKKKYPICRGVSFVANMCLTVSVYTGSMPRSDFVSVFDL